MNERGHLSAETLDLLALSALAARETQDAQGHLGSCVTCKRRWEELNEDKQRFEQFVFPRTLPKVEARARSGRSLFGAMAERWRFLVPALGVGAAAAIALVVMPQVSSPPYVGEKGGPSVEVVARRGQSQFEVRTGTHLKPRDQIRFVVVPGGARYLLIASRDGQGNLNVYYPFAGAESGELGPSREELPGAIELDDVLGTERLYALFSDQPLKADLVRQQLSLPGDKVRDLPGLKEAITREFVKDAQ